MTHIRLRAALEDLTLEQIKASFRCLREPVLKGRKAELVEQLHRGLLRKSTVGKVVGELDSLERTMLAEAVHSDFGELNLDRLRAKYGRLPDSLDSSKARSSLRLPSGMLLFVYANREGHFIPHELHAPLRALLDPPAPVTIEAIEELPPSVHEQKLIIHKSEPVAARELGPMLRLVQQGVLKLTPSKRQPTKNTLGTLAAHLVEGDHYPDRKHPHHEQAGAIRAFAWPQLLQAGKLAAVHDNKLGMTAQGRKSTSQPPDQTLHALWKAWLNWNRFDEFSRIDAIRGQKQGPRGLTAVTPRRQTIAQALTECPVGQWVAINDFLRFMQAEEFSFEICHDPRQLYVDDRRYGSLGYAGCHGWNVLQKRYVLVVLFEYAATLGLVDLAFIHPSDTQADYELWGADCLSFLSRYDGLQYFRINAHGAWCLGMDKRPAATGTSAGLHVMPSLQIEGPKQCVDAHMEMMLDTWAVREGPGCWHLDRARLLEAMENGLDLDQFRQFLASSDDQPLLEKVEALFKSCRENADAVRPVEEACVYECRNETDCRSIAEHPEMVGLGQRLDRKRLVVATRHQTRFREALRVIGFGMARG